MAIKEVDQKSYDELIGDLQHRYGRLHTRFDFHIVGEDESPTELAELKGLIDSLNVEDKNLNKKIDEINKRFDSIEVGDIDLSAYVKKSELPDLSEYAKKSELPTETTDLSIYALKTDLENLPQGGTTLSAVEISKKLTLNGVADYDQLMNYRLVFVNDSDKPITITIQEYDYTSSTYVTKDHTFQPQEEWLNRYGGFKPAKAEGTYPTIILKVDGVVQNIPRNEFAMEGWPLKAYIHPYHLMVALYRSIM